MRRRFMMRSVCLKPAALLVVAAAAVVEGVCAACPSLQFQSTSCIMASIGSTLFRSGMSSPCVCSYTHVDALFRIGLYV